MSMRLKKDPLQLNGPRGAVQIQRNSRGIPCIKAGHIEDLLFGQGFVHANDRQLQVLLTRLAFQGRTAECLAAHPDLIELDTQVRKINFLPDADSQIVGLEPDVLGQLQAYVDGFNVYLSQNRPVFEFRLLGYKPEPLEIKDVISLSKVMGFVGLAETQGNMEKFILQMVQKGVPEEHIRELFPYLTDVIDAGLLQTIKVPKPVLPEGLAWLGRLPRMSASNSWAVSGRLTASGRPFLCNDPHLEVNRLPGIWQEVVLELPERSTKGAGLPGCPGVFIGRNPDLAYGVTYAFMDMIDFRIEHCRDGKYRRGQEWIPFRHRHERIKLKKGPDQDLVFYENDWGVLEGDPYTEGYYLLMSWAAARGCGGSDLSLLSLLQASSVEEGLAICRGVHSGAWCFVFADTRGDIGFQMTGRLFKRPEGVSGLLPTPAWLEEGDAPEFEDQDDLPSLINPEAGFLVTANQDLNHLGAVNPINLPMASYRADRITRLLQDKAVLDIPCMQAMQLDLYSIQAEKIMPLLRPHLPDSENGRILGDWDCCYGSESRGATLFEAVYLELVKQVFGNNGLGRDVLEHLLQETALFSDYFGNFDRILLDPGSVWFQGLDREALVQQALTSGLARPAQPYGQTRQVMLSHLLFGGKLPKWLGFDRGPIPLPGSRATILQGQIFQTLNRTTTFSPSYRLVVDLSRETLFSALPGGVSDRRFSDFYVNTLSDWLNGVYEEL